MAARSSDSITSGETYSGEHATVTGYVVVRTAPGARPSLAGLTIAVTDLKKVHAGGDLSRPWAWQLQKFESGSACPGAPSSVCVLG